MASRDKLLAMLPEHLLLLGIELLAWRRAQCVAAALVILAFFLKAAVVPLHAWAPDAYEDASVPVMAFMAVLVKAAVLLAAARQFGNATLAQRSGVPSVQAWSV